MLNKGAVIDITDDFDGTPLMIAALSGHSEIVKLLLDNGANSNMVDNHGFTPLMLAKKNSHNDIVALLKKYEAK